MTLVLFFLAIEAGLELVMVHSPLWHGKKMLSIGLSGAAILGASALLTINFSLWTLLLAIMAVYRVINLARLIQERMNEAYLSQKFQTSSLWLTIIQLGLVVVNWLGLSAHFWLRTSALGLVVISSVLLYLTTKHIKQTRPPAIELTMADRDLPSLTVAIPARNETEDLELCLQGLVASDYPKLEVLVLDDCSQNKRTPDIIRQFAHDGVRFISGKVPPKGWLAKNYAYQQLVDQASGDLLLFCGVDTRFQPGSLRQIVLLQLQTGHGMLSIMPRNQLIKTLNPERLMVQPNRYAWELALPRGLFRRPPVLSTCWLIKRQFLRTAGSLNSVRNSIVPESYFARRAISTRNGYGFYGSNAAIGLSCDKQLSDQRDTAIRVRYPQLHRRPELAGMLMLFELWLLLLPLVGLIVSLTQTLWLAALLYGVSSLLLISCYSLIVRQTYRRFIWRSLWLLPVAAIYDVVILNVSMWQYEFNEVVWKGRNVCVPIMRVYSQLPKI